MSKRPEFIKDTWQEVISTTITLAAQTTIKAHDGGKGFTAAAIADGFDEANGTMIVALASAGIISQSGQATFTLSAEIEVISWTGIEISGANVKLTGVRTDVTKLATKFARSGVSGTEETTFDGASLVQAPGKLSGREGVRIYNPDATIVEYVAFSANEIAANSLPIAAGAILDLPIDETIDIWLSSASGTPTVFLLEYK